MLHLTAVTPISLGYLTLGGFVVVFNMITLLVKEKLYIGEVVLGTAFGVIIGPNCAGWFNPREWGSTLEAQNIITLEVMRVVLAIGLFAIGVALPEAYLAKNWKSLVVMVVPTMAFGWVICAGLIHGLFPQLSLISALVISACLTPTDPILAAAIVGGDYAEKNVPESIRDLLSAESAANDGLAYPFLSISLYLMLESSSLVAVEKWLLVGCLYQVLFGSVLGFVIGLSFSHIMKISQRKGLIDHKSFVAQYLALAIFTIGIATSLGADDLLAAFAAGCAVSWDDHFKTQTKNEAFSVVIDLILNCACFIYIGAWLPFDMFNSTELGIAPWKLVVLFLGILFLRRIPCLLLLYKFIPDVKDWREALLCGHFGPMGVSAIFVSTLALTRLPEPSNHPTAQTEILAASLHPIVSFVVLCSILVHGLSIPAIWLGHGMHTKALVLSRTWTTRSTTKDWTLSISRVPRLVSAAVLQTSGSCYPGVHRDSARELEGGGLPNPPDHIRPRQLEHQQNRFGATHIGSGVESQVFLGLDSSRFPGPPKESVVSKMFTSNPGDATEEEPTRVWQDEEGPSRIATLSV